MRREVKRAYKEGRSVAILVNGVIVDEPETYKKFKKAFKQAVAFENPKLVEVRISAF